MELMYPQRTDGMYILSRFDIDEIAYSLLKDFSPRNLEYAIAVDIDAFLVDYLQLLVKERYIGVIGCEALGLTVMRDSVEIPSLDEKMHPIILKETYGNVLISPTLNGVKNRPRKRYTKAHEGAHWVLHQPYFQNADGTEQGRLCSGFVACRTVERYIPTTSRKVNWLEWQADTLAASLLMPRDIFMCYTKSLFRRAGVRHGYLSAKCGSDKQLFHEIAPDLCKKFSVSLRAVQIRMIHLGLIRTGAI